MSHRYLSLILSLLIEIHVFVCIVFFFWRRLVFGVSKRRHHLKFINLANWFVSIWFVLAHLLCLKRSQISKKVGGKIWKYKILFKWLDKFFSVFLKFISRKNYSKPASLKWMLDKKFIFSRKSYQRIYCNTILLLSFHNGFFVSRKRFRSKIQNKSIYFNNFHFLSSKRFICKN